MRRGFQRTCRTTLGEDNAAGVEDWGVGETGSHMRGEEWMRAAATSAQPCTMTTTTAVALGVTVDGNEFTAAMMHATAKKVRKE